MTSENAGTKEYLHLPRKDPTDLAALVKAASLPKYRDADTDLAIFDATRELERKALPLAEALLEARKALEAAVRELCYSCDQQRPFDEDGLHITKFIPRQDPKNKPIFGTKPCKAVSQRKALDKLREVGA